MDVYYFVIILTFILCKYIKVPENDLKAYTIKVIWVFMPIMIYGALRYDFGNDYWQYEMWYNQWHRYMTEVDSDEHAEVGYQWLNMIMPTWQSLLILVSGSVVAAYMLLYSKYVDPKVLMVAVFFTMLYPDQCFFLQFISMRCGLAIAGVYMSLPLIIKRKYLLLIPLAFGLSLFHTSAILFLPLAVIVGQSLALTKKEIYVWFGIVVVTIFMSQSTLINYVTPFLMSDQFESYRTHYLEADSHASILNGTANVILGYFIVSWAWRNRRVLTKAQNVIWRLSLLYLMCPFLGALGRTRMTFYYIPFYIITITYLMNDKWPAKWQKTVFITLAVAVMLYATFVVWMNNPYFRLQHYHSIFSE